MAEVHLTKAGRDKLAEELQRLRGPGRIKLHKAIQEAVAHGDLRENGEYQSAKRDQEIMEARISYLEDRLGRHRLLDARDISTDRVMIGTTVTIEDLKTKDKETYTLLAEEESDHQHGIIAVTTPFARGLMGKKTGEEVTIAIPAGAKKVKILSIKLYEGLK